MDISAANPMRCGEFTFEPTRLFNPAYFRYRVQESHKFGPLCLFPKMAHSGYLSLRGIEIVGGFVPFSVARAVSPFNPVRPVFPNPPEAGTVTYDPEADAAFIYLEYDPSFAQLAPQAQGELKTVSHSVNPTATYGLDDQGGLVWVKIPIADVSGPVEQLLRLLRK